MYDNENGQGYGSPDNSNQWNQPNDGRAGINQPNQQQYYAPQTSRTYYSGENYSPFPNEGPLPTGVRTPRFAIFLHPLDLSSVFRFSDMKLTSDSIPAKGGHFI